MITNTVEYRRCWILRLVLSCKASVQHHQQALLTGRPLMEINSFGFLLSRVIFLLSPLDVVGRVGIDVPPVVAQHYWLNADEACGALDSCQIIQLRKVADTRFHPHPHQFIFMLAVRSSLLGHSGSRRLQVKVLRSSAAGEEVWRSGRWRRRRRCAVQTA